MKQGGETVGLLHIHVENETEIDHQEEGLLREVSQDLGYAWRKIRAETKLLETQQQVIEQERHRALGTMASGIAHDFNNALSTIMGVSDLLLQSEEILQDREKAAYYLEMVRKAAGGAVETVRRLRKFYRPSETAQFAPVDLNGLIEEAVSMTRPRWQEQARAEGANIAVTTDLGEIDALQGNEAELHEMLTNLIFNAVDAMPEGGTLNLQTRQVEDQIILEVIDTGTGMSASERQHCLEPFFTTKQDEGTGLGLSTVRGIVEGHNGRITVASEQGKGTTFRIVFPCGQAMETDTSQEDAARKTRPLNVLVVEDEGEQRQLLVNYLTIDDHRVDTAANGRAGLRQFRKDQHKLVITDRSMPELSGDVVAAEVKSQAPDTPVIMLTGLGVMMEAAEDEVEGADLIVSKPVTLEEVRKAISKVIASVESTETDGTA
jgi:signal transduction histidine kinase/ActR/RegA family two-component response regulator